MKVIQKKIEAGMIRLEAVATVNEVANALNAAQVSFAASMGIQPARGKTVAQAVEEKTGIKNLDSIVACDAIKALVPFALDRKNIVPLFLPEPQATSPLERGRQFSFTLDVTPKPRYELSSYEPVEFTAHAFVPNENLVSDQLKKLVEGYVTYQSAAAKPVEEGDVCLIAMECFEDGRLLESLSTDGRTYVVGQGYMPAGFDEGIYGMTPGETRSFSFEGPSLDENFNPLTQKVDCTVAIKEIQQAALPEINDEWVRANMPWFKSLDELRGDIASKIERQERAQYDSYLRQLAIAELAKRFEGKIPDEAYEATRASLVDNIRLNLKQRGKTWEEFVRESGGEQQLGMMLMLQTRETLVRGFALDAVYRHEKLTVSDSDIDEACASVNHQVNPKQIRQQFERSGQLFVLRESAERIKAGKWIVAHAKISIIE